MGSRPFPEIPCALCSKPVELAIDLCADENGKAVHEECYVQRIKSSSSNSAAAMMAASTGAGANLYTALART